MSTAEQGQTLCVLVMGSMSCLAPSTKAKSLSWPLRQLSLSGNMDFGVNTVSLFIRKMRITVPFLQSCEENEMRKMLTVSTLIISSFYQQYLAMFSLCFQHSPSPAHLRVHPSLHPALIPPHQEN